MARHTRVLANTHARGHDLLRAAFGLAHSDKVERFAAEHAHKAVRRWADCGVLPPSTRTPGGDRCWRRRAVERFADEHGAPIREGGLSGR